MNGPVTLHISELSDPIFIKSRYLLIFSLDTLFYICDLS